MTADANFPAYRLPVGVLSRSVEGEMVLLSMTSEEYFSLDRVGADIVMQITERPFDDALMALANDYEVPLGVLRADVVQLIAELCAEGLLEPVRDS